jgi:N-methylhydantoinase A
MGKDPLKARTGFRLALFEENTVKVNTPVYSGDKLKAGNVVKGPAIIEEDTTTIVVFPRWQVELDGRDLYRMTLQK